MQRAHVFANRINLGYTGKQTQGSKVPYETVLLTIVLGSTTDALTTDSDHSFDTTRGCKSLERIHHTQP